MNSTSGKFTAPRNGTYSFSFTGAAYLPSSSSRVHLDVILYLIFNWVGRGMADEVTAAQYETISGQSTLDLVAGDEIWLEIDYIVTGSFLWGYLATHFSDHLLEENIAIV